MTKTFIDHEPFVAELNAMITARKRIISGSSYSPEAKQKAEHETQAIKMVLSMTNDSRYRKGITI